MEVLAPKYRYDPNEKIQSVYVGVANGNRTMVSVVKRHRTEDRLERVKAYVPGLLPRGKSQRAGFFVLGGMETTLDEIKDIVGLYREKKFQARRSPGEISKMCEGLRERRWDAWQHLKRNPSERRPQPRRTLHLPVGCRLVSTNEPGMKVTVRG